MTPHRSRKVTADPRPHCVYEHYDKDGVLLYVGCCREITNRTYQHAAASPWTPFAARSHGTWFPSLHAARAAETAAIRAGNPIFNVHGYALNHRPTTSEREQRRTAYLKAHRRVRRISKREASDNRRELESEAREAG